MTQVLFFFKFEMIKESNCPTDGDGKGKKKPVGEGERNVMPIALVSLSPFFRLEFSAGFYDILCALFG
jgi:hypothetical protein